MATVDVVTAGGGDTYRIERVYLDSDPAYEFARNYNGTAPNEPVHVEEWQTGAPPGAYDGPYWRAEWWDAYPPASAEVSCGTPARVSALMTSTSARSGGPARRYPRPSWCAGNWRACRRWRSWACRGRRWRSCSGTRLPRSGRTWREYHGISFHFCVTSRNDCALCFDIAARDAP